MLSLKHKILMTAAAVGLLSASGMSAVANAQNSYMPQQGEQQQMNVTDAQLQEFAEAEAAVRQVQSKFQGQMQSVETQAEMQAIQQQASQEMTQAIQQTDLNVQEYNQIVSLVQTNPEVQKRYIQLTQ